jgi:predicted membrane protein
MNNKFNNKYVFLFTIILILEIFFLIPKIYNNLIFNNKISLEKTLPISILNNPIEKYPINSTFKNLSGIKFVFGTYKRENNEKIEFNLYDDKGKKIYTTEINAKKLKDNNEYIIKFKKIKESKNQKFFFDLKSINGTEKNSIAIYTNGNNVLYDLGYSNLNIKLIFGIIIFLIFSIYLFFTFYFLKNHNKKKEKIFLVLSLFYCSTFLFLIPPFGISDEAAHFYKSYATATGQIKNPSKIPVSVLKLTENIGFSEYILNHGKINVVDIKKSDKIPLLKKNVENVDSGGAALYNPLSYIPQALGILIGSYFNLSILKLFYFGRIFTLLIWTVVMYISIKNAPSQIKDILLILGLSPVVVQESFAYSTDVLVISFSFLLVSFLFKLYLNKDEKFNLKYGIIFFLGVFIPTIAKIPYFLFAFLLLLLPTSKFKTKKQYYLVFFIIMFVTLLVSFVWSKVSPSYIWDTHENVIYLIKNPIEYLKLLFVTTKNEIILYTEESIGIIAWTTKLSLIITYGYLILLIISIFSKNIMKEKNFKFYFIMLLVLLGIYIGISTALFVAWTPIGSEYIRGIQGRYFIPIIPVLAIFVSQKKIIINKDKLELYINLFLNFGLAYTLIQIFERFYL